MTLKKFFRVGFLVFLGAGLLLMISEEIYRKLHKKEGGYADVWLWTERGILSVTLSGKERSEIKELLKSLKSFKNTVWFGVPDIEDCPLEVWDSEEVNFYKLCRGKDGKWYVALPGSSRGRSITNYYKVDEERALSVIEKVKKFFPEKSSSP